MFKNIMAMLNKTLPKTFSRLIIINEGFKTDQSQLIK